MKPQIRIIINPNGTVSAGANTTRQNIPDWITPQFAVGDILTAPDWQGTVTHAEMVTTVDGWRWYYSVTDNDGSEHDSEVTLLKYHSRPCPYLDKIISLLQEAQS